MAQQALPFSQPASKRCGPTCAPNGTGGVVVHRRRLPRPVAGISGDDLQGGQRSQDRQDCPTAPLRSGGPEPAPLHPNKGSGIDRGIDQRRCNYRGGIEPGRTAGRRFPRTGGVRLIGSPGAYRRIVRCATGGREGIHDAVGRLDNATLCRCVRIVAVVSKQKRRRWHLVTLHSEIHNQYNIVL